MEVQGTIKVIQDTEAVSDKFQKRLLVIETAEKYPQQLPIEFVQDAVSKLDNLAEGEEVTVHINLRGREYNGRYYSSIQGWKVEVTETEKPPF